MEDNSFHLENEVIKLLEIDNITLNMMCQELEERGYTFIKADQNQYWFRDNDILLLRRFLTLAKQIGMTLQNAADKVLLKDEASDRKVVITKKQDPDNEIPLNCTFNTQVLLEHIQKFNQELLQRMNEQQKHYESLLQNQQSYIENALSKIQKDNMSLAAANLEEKKQGKWGFWYRIFFEKDPN